MMSGIIAAIAGTVVATGFSVASGFIGAGKAKNAQDRATDAELKVQEDALDERKRMFDIMQNSLAPYMDAGAGALSDMRAMLGMDTDITTYTALDYEQPRKPVLTDVPIGTKLGSIQHYGSGPSPQGPRDGGGHNVPIGTKLGSKTQAQGTISFKPEGNLAPGSYTKEQEQDPEKMEKFVAKMKAWERKKKQRDDILTVAEGRGIPIEEIHLHPDLVPDYDFYGREISEADRYRLLKEYFPSESETTTVSGEERQQEIRDEILGGGLYAEGIKQGEQGMLANASATGGLRGGNLQQALSEFRPKLFNQLWEQRYNKLSGLAGLGQNSAAGAGSGAMDLAGGIGSSANQVSDIYRNQGEYNANSILGKAGAVGGTVGAAGNTLAKFGMGKYMGLFDGPRTETSSGFFDGWN